MQYSKLGIRVASRVTERLKTQNLKKLGNIRKISDLGGHIAQCLVSFQKLRLCKQQFKNTQKQIPNFSFPVQFYWIIPFCSKYFVRDCSFMKEIFELRLSSRPVREQYKLNLNIPRKRQVTFGTKSLKSLGPKIWNNLHYHIKSAKNLKVFKNLIKNGMVPPVVAMCVHYGYLSTILFHR